MAIQISLLNIKCGIYVPRATVAQQRTATSMGCQELRLLFACGQKQDACLVNMQGSKNLDRQTPTTKTTTTGNNSSKGSANNDETDPVTVELRAAAPHAETDLEPQLCLALLTCQEGGVTLYQHGKINKQFLVLVVFEFRVLKAFCL